jgi:Vacuolar sorting protein 9 (VPS9) domain
MHGADDSLPLFVYVLLKAKVENLLSNYNYIKNYRYKPRREFRDPVEFKYTFTSLKVAIRFILEIKSNKLHLLPDENFKELVVGCKRKTQETQTAIQDVPFDELELHPMLKENYTGEISVEHFLKCPKDLEVFIADYYTLLNLNKFRN